ncbi:MAG: hypothetical protein A2233_02415 [Candidatus Kerfeldbacteria bacterium RIFOXYA2_FULL_38_24]|uniref:Cell division protein FtsX n=1 Tax=Candidatus Kerfeldbacteria bacterium RIFOXYB2_FULL_38_14 TaxID=1798547 RepID=A0A1G2BC32_9BACT|nr:MAG: hypothetical protein A2233_02415 [Candidatus Kerfeldbacteria bacterium RIFOXYA2_FULL_38_24]OGY85850.1 MAG: hypothetical protein A2319_05855 [Candidatus Kerfeldbacteria bacterium RIFOXYB2_FULL_38_14]OGY89111.1 MAG: hypothetical protein A2458_02525 [Candidatus Kerfeldbacteria bacterium RIFOXYC2_FULL_38_9]
MILALARATKFAIQNFWRNLWLSIITVFILVLTTMSITLVVGMNVIGQQIISAVEQKVDVDLYFYDNVSEEQILQAQKYTQTIEGVADVIYISKTDALAKFRESHKDDPSIIAALDELDENVLPASLTIRAKDIEKYPGIIEAFQKSNFNTLIDRTDYSDNQDIINGITQITQRAYQIGMGVSIIFVIIAIIVIFNTIRITIYSHREEVGIMKLVGATNWFVRGPFILESVLIGLISAFITTLLFGTLLYFSDATVRAFFSGYDFSIFVYFQKHLLSFVLAELAIGVVLSVVSSMVAINRHLKT